MAVTVTPYNHTVKKLVNAEVNYSTLKLMLLDDNQAALFDATDTDLTGISGNEVDGNGWDSGGEAIANAAVTVVTTNDAKLDADDVSVIATGGAIGPAESAVIYDATGNEPLLFVDFGEAKTADVGTNFVVQWHASGIFTFTIT